MLFSRVGPVSNFPSVMHCESSEYSSAATAPVFVGVRQSGVIKRKKRPWRHQLAAERHVYTLLCVWDLQQCFSSRVGTCVYSISDTESDLGRGAPAGCWCARLKISPPPPPKKKILLIVKLNINKRLCSSGCLLLLFPWNAKRVCNVCELLQKLK